MRYLGLTYEDLRSAAKVLTKYAVAVENRLYMDMKTEDAHAAINEAEHLAEIFNEVADKLDTVTPADLG